MDEELPTPRDHVRLDVECPEGVEAGQMVLLTTPDGRSVEVEVPEGIGAGDTFQAFVGNEDAASAEADQEDIDGNGGLEAWVDVDGSSGSDGSRSRSRSSSGDGSSGGEMDPQVAALLSAGLVLSAAEDSDGEDAVETEPVDVREWSGDEAEDGARDDAPEEEPWEPVLEPDAGLDGDGSGTAGSGELELPLEPSVTPEEDVAEGVTEGVAERPRRSSGRSKRGARGRKQRKGDSLRGQRPGKIGESTQRRSRQILAEATAHSPRTRRLASDRLSEISGRLAQEASFGFDRDPGKFSSDDDAEAAELESGRLMVLNAEAAEEAEAVEIRRRRSASRRRALAEERRRQDRIHQAREKSRASVLAAEERRRIRAETPDYVVPSPQCPPRSTSSARGCRRRHAASPPKRPTVEQQDSANKRHAAFHKRVQDGERQRLARLAAKKQEKEEEDKKLLLQSSARSKEKLEALEAKRKKQDIAKSCAEMHGRAKQLAKRREDLRKAHDLERDLELRAASAPLSRSPPPLRRSESNSAGEGRPHGTIWSRLFEEGQIKQAEKQESERRQERIAREKSRLSTTPLRTISSQDYHPANSLTPLRSTVRARGSPPANRKPPPAVLVGPKPPPLMNKDIAHVIIQAASWVAVQGHEFERTLRTKYATDPRFLFLFQKHSRGAEYYRARLLFETQQQCFAPHSLRPVEDRRKIMTGQSPRLSTASKSRTPKKIPRNKATSSTPRNGSKSRRTSSRTPRTPNNNSAEANVNAEKQKQQRQDERAAAASRKLKETKQVEAAKQAELAMKRAEKARVAAEAKAERQRAASARRSAETKRKEEQDKARQAEKEMPTDIRGGGGSTQQELPSTDFVKTKKPAANATLHVGGIEGELEDEEQLRELFSQFGAVDTVTLRRRREGKKVSWALITFESSEGVDQAVSAQSSLKNDGLVVRPVDMATVKRSTGAMGKVMHQHRSTIDAAGVATMELFHVDESRLAAIERRHLAAVKMQALWRGRLAREKVLAMIDVDESDEGEDGQMVERGRWSRVRFLEAVPLMKGMSHAELRRIADAMAMEHYEDEELFEEGEDGDSMYIVKDGVAVAEKGGTQVARYRSGDYFGERVLTEGGGKRGATVRADGSVECLRLSYGPFHELMGRCSHVAALFNKQAETYSNTLQSTDGGLKSQLAAQAVQEQARRREAANFAAAEAEAAVAASQEAASAATAVAEPAPEPESLQESEGERAVRKAEGAVKRTAAEIAAVIETFKVGVPISVIETGQTGVVQSASTEGLVRVLLDEPDGRPLPKILQADAIRVAKGEQEDKEKLEAKAEAAAQVARTQEEAAASSVLERSAAAEKDAADRAKMKMELEALIGMSSSSNDDNDSDYDDEAATAEADLNGAVQGAPAMRDRNWSSDPTIDADMLTPPALGDRLMSETLSAVRSALGRQDAQERLVKEICSVMNCDRASIFLIDQKTDELVIHGSRDEDARDIRIPRTMGIAGISAASGEHLAINDTYNEPRFDPAVDSQTGYKTRQLMSTAIRDETKAIVGVLQAINKPDGCQGFGAEDSKLLEEFAVLAGRTLTYSVSLSSGGDDFVQIVPDRRSIATEGNDDADTEKGGAAEDEEIVESFEFACPDGIEPGQLLYVTTPLGREIELIVPEGVQPGDMVQVGDPSEEEPHSEEAHEHDPEEGKDERQASNGCITITVPDGVRPGDMISVELPDSQEIDVEVPEGLQAGDQFELEFELDEDANEQAEESEATATRQGIQKELKVVLLGRSGCGKTTLLSRFLSPSDDFGAIDYSPTVGMCQEKCTATAINRLLHLVVWDRSGADTYGAVTAAYYKKAACGIVVYDATAPESFEEVGSWIEELRSLAPGRTRCPAVLVALNSDGEGAVVSHEAGENAAESYDCCAFVDGVSVLDGTGVQQIFEAAGFAALEQVLPDEAAAARAETGIAQGYSNSYSMSQTAEEMELEDQEEHDETTEYVEVNFTVINANTRVIADVRVEISGSTDEVQSTRAVASDEYGMAHWGDEEQDTLELYVRGPQPNSESSSRSLVHVKLVLDDGGDILGELDLDLAEEFASVWKGDEEDAVLAMRRPLQGAEEGMEIELTVAINSGESI